MRTRSGLVGLGAVAALVTVGCGGGDDDVDGEPVVGEVEAADAADEVDEVDEVDSDDTEPSDEPTVLTDAPAPGEAHIEVDGRSFVLDEQGALACSIGEDSVTISFRANDNLVTLGGGLNRIDDGWIGTASLDVAEPGDEPGPIAFFPTPDDVGVIDSSLIAIDGSSFQYSGPMLKQPANDGSVPDPVDVGDGTIRATCP